METRTSLGLLAARKVGGFIKLTLEMSNTEPFGPFEEVTVKSLFTVFRGVASVGNGQGW